MQKLTKEQAIVLTGYTGITCVDFGLFHEDVEIRLGRPITTLEFLVLKDKIKELYKSDFMAMLFENKE